MVVFSRAVGYRFGPHLADTVPVLIDYCTSASENDEELREYSLQVLCITSSALFLQHIYFLQNVISCLLSVLCLS